MLILPKPRSLRREANFSGQPSATLGTAVTSHATNANQLGTKVDVIATTSFDTDWVEIICHNNFAAATDSDTLLNIYVGGSGSEQLVIPNLLAGWVGTLVGGGIVKRYAFPLRIPGGSTIRADCQSQRTNTAMRLMLMLFGDGQDDHWTGTKVEAVGADTATSSGTYITSGTASEGTFTNVGTNTNEFGFVQPMIGGNTDTTLTDTSLVADLGINGVALTGLGDFVFYGDSSERLGNMSMGRYCRIPASSDLELRAQADTTTESKAWVVYGVY